MINNGKIQWQGPNGKVSRPAREDWYAVVRDPAYQRYLRDSRGLRGVFKDESIVRKEEVLTQSDED